ncbi:hypothetical protein AJ80_06377 [Polytolypa hystricis UAMH7299]|uniref:Altered inheritance of mitochondria protein 6 n=1 Tax=Polytolypa hystricis (strain UAMH7299) TaxID=1447883 RepID=A0A2B7XXR0_POLH7|nr:hypothetical protein AJ80_06377 [Polytolypa hystricis UAMH7299]
MANVTESNSGVVQLMTLALGAFVTFFPKEVEWFVDRWGQPGRPTDPLAHWPTDMLADVTPVACHSHNDYWRRVPLFSALEAGCISVEADVWLFDDDLYVGHTTSSLTVNRTLSNLYINPLLEILSNQNPTTHFHPSLDTPPNGVFDTDPSQSLVLLVDFKAKGKAIWPYLIRQLSPLRDRGYLTHFNGTSIIQRPITVVATGDAPFDLVVANRNYRDVFFDAPLGDLTGFGKGHAATSAPHLVDDDDEELDLDGIHLSASGFRPSRISLRMGNSKSKLDTQKKPAPDPAIYDQSNSFYASVSFKRSIGFPWGFHLSSNQLETIRAQVNAAHARGLKVRYWSIPSWPRSLRNHLWAALVREGVDILNVDDLRAATRQDWFKLVKKR